MPTLADLNRLRAEKGSVVSIEQPIQGRSPTLADLNRLRAEKGSVVSIEQPIQGRSPPAPRIRGTGGNPYNNPLINFVKGVGTGLAEPVAGIAQLIGQIPVLPEGAKDFIDRTNRNFFRSRDAILESGAAQAGNIVGRVGPAVALPATTIPRALLSGASLGAAQPVEPGGGSRLANIALGAGTAGLGPLLGGIPSAVQKYGGKLLSTDKGSMIADAGLDILNVGREYTTVRLAEIIANSLIKVTGIKDAILSPKLKGMISKPALALATQIDKSGISPEIDKVYNNLTNSTATMAKAMDRKKEGNRR